MGDEMKTSSKIACTLALGMAFLTGNYVRNLFRPHQLQHEESQFQNSPDACRLSNGMQVDGCKVEGRMGGNSKIVSVNTGVGSMTIYDKGIGEPYAIYNWEKRTQLTYRFGRRDFPIWEPYAFRKSSEYGRFFDNAPEGYYRFFQHVKGTDKSE